MEGSYKNIFVLGGTGRTGQAVIRNLLLGGYKVRALARDLDKVINFKEGNVEWVKGDATDEDCLKKAFAGSDCVLSALGPKGTGVTTIMCDTIKTIISALRVNKIKRVIWIGGDMTDTNHSWVVRNTIFKLVLNNIFADLTNMENWVNENDLSDLEWTCCRPFELVEKKFTGKYKVGTWKEKFETKTVIEDLADFIVKEMTEKKWVRQYVTVGNAP